MHSGTADAADGLAGREARQTCSHDCQRQGGALSTGSGAAAVSCAGAESALALRLHVCGQLERVHLRGLCARCLCQADRGLAETNWSIIPTSVGTVADSYDNTLAETIHGLYKAEPIHRRGPWHSFEAVEFATLEWVDWFKNRRLMGPIGNIPHAEAEERYYASLECPTLVASLKLNGLRHPPGCSISGSQCYPRSTGCSGCAN